MNWLNIRKAKRQFKDLRQLREEGLREDLKERRENKVIGDTSSEPKGARRGSIFDMEEDRLKDEELAEMARTDLMDVVMERIGQMSKDELIDILIQTRGTMEATV